MVEGAKSFFRSTVSQTDDRNFRALPSFGSYTVLNPIYSAASKQAKTVQQTNRAVHLMEARSLFQHWQTLFLAASILLESKGSVHSWAQSFEVEEFFSSATVPLPLPELTTSVSFVWALPCPPPPSSTFDVTRIMLYAIDHTKTAPICSKRPLTLLLITSCYWPSLATDYRHKQAYKNWKLHWIIVRQQLTYSHRERRIC